MSRYEAFVVCPTEYGGHIEHAHDMATGLLGRPDVDGVTIVTRRGARDYLGLDRTSPVRVAEVIPPRRLPGEGRRARAERAAGQVLDLVTEQRAIRRVVGRATGSPVVVMEVLRYPNPRLLAPREDAQIVSFLHNAKPHSDSAGARERVLMALQNLCLERSDRVVVHGVTQEETARGRSSTPVSSAPLPVTSFLRAGDGRAIEGLAGRALCIGEVRANKGVELAIAAAKEAGVPLTILGKSESESLSHSLAALAGDADVIFQDRFLHRDEFESAIAQAHLVVLPYTHFDAQSGILSRAMGAKRRVVASDLAALRDQAGDYAYITYADAYSATEFGAAMRSAMSEGAVTDDSRAATPEAEWGAVADAILGDR